MSPPSPCAVAGDAYLVDVPPAGSYDVIAVPSTNSGSVLGALGTNVNSWTAVATGLSSVTDCVWTGVNYIAVGPGTRSAYSPDGRAWTLVDAQNTFTDPFVVFGQNFNASISSYQIIERAGFAQARASYTTSYGVNWTTNNTIIGSSITTQTSTATYRPRQLYVSSNGTGTPFMSGGQPGFYYINNFYNIGTSNSNALNPAIANGTFFCNLTGGTTLGLATNGSSNLYYNIDGFGGYSTLALSINIAYIWLTSATAGFAFSTSNANPYYQSFNVTSGQSFLFSTPTMGNVVCVIRGNASSALAGRYVLASSNGIYSGTGNFPTWSQVNATPCAAIATRTP